MAEVVRIALPLVLASSGNALNIFTDRVMLARYSDVTMAAAFPAGLTLFSLACLFFGTIGYTGSFVAQYVGARRFRRVGVAVWQGIFLALIGGVVMALTGLAAPLMFRWFGHAPEIQELEVVYYRILANWMWVNLVSCALCSFWGGRGKTWMVMCFNFIVTLLNIPFNYLLIFGHRFELPGGWVVAFPELGIAGAAWGTALSGLGGMLFLTAGFFSPGARKVYSTASRIVDFALFRRLLFFGTPSGVQFFLDLVSFNTFVVSLGRISVEVLTASGIVFSINSLAFTPMIGVGQTTAILVGQSIGAGDIPHATRSVSSARKLVIGYMGFMSIFFLFYPDPLFALFSVSKPEVLHLTRFMLYFICVYLIFDGLFIVHGNAIKGAGDTRFSMWVGTLMSLGVYALPCVGVFLLAELPAVSGWLGDRLPRVMLWAMWLICVVYVISISIIFYLRYRGGKWKSMRVIEDAPDQ